MLTLKLQYFGHLMRRTDWKSPWCWERLKAGGEGDNRWWDGWMESPTQWMWVWGKVQELVNSRTGMPGVLQSMGSQRVRQSWATELNWPPSPAPPYRQRSFVYKVPSKKNLTKNTSVVSLDFFFFFCLWNSHFHDSEPMALEMVTFGWPLLIQTRALFQVFNNDNGAIWASQVALVVKILPANKGD